MQVLSARVLAFWDPRFTFLMHLCPLSTSRCSLPGNKVGAPKREGEAGNGLQEETRVAGGMLLVCT